MELDGLITFESSYHALRAERALQNEGIPGKLVPAPHDLSPTCVVALRFPWKETDRVGLLFNKLRIEFDQCLQRPENHGIPKGWT